MIKVVMIWLFFLYLLIPAFFSSGTEVLIQFWPFSEPVTMSLSSVVLLFAAMGVAMTLGWALIDRTQIMVKNKKLHRELEKSREEIQSLRQLMTMERDVE